MSLIKIALLAAMASFGPVEVPDSSMGIPPVQQTGYATTYGLGGFHGTHTATGERFRPNQEITCAHKSLPLGMVVYVENPRTGKMIWCRINDRGPYVVRTPEGRTKAVTPSYKTAPGERWVRILDMSVAASKKLDTWGLFPVKIRYWGRPVRAQNFLMED